MTIRVLACSGSLEGGGSERQLWQFVNGLPADRFSTAVYLLYRRGRYLKQLPPTTPVFDFASNYRSRLWWPGRIHRAQVRHLARVLREKGIDVVYDRTYHMTLITGAACRQAGVPRISVITSPPSRDLGEADERFRSWKRRLLAQHYADPASLTVAVSNEVAEDAARFYGIDSGSIEILPNAIDLQRVQAEAQVKLPGHAEELRDAGPFWVMVARMTPEKGHRIALQAFAQYVASTPQAAGTELWLIGDGPMRRELQHLAQELHLNQQVRFLGAMDNPYPYIRAARGLILPSHYEGLPNVALEAMALGCRVIATRSSRDLDSLLAANRGQVVDVGDANGLAAAMLQRDAASDEALRQQLDAAQQYVARHFGLASWLGRMEELLCQRISKSDSASLPHPGGAEP